MCLENALTAMTDSPRITHVSWGRLEVEGENTSFKDAKLFPGGAREWDWNETGTSHSPGIQPEDVQELLDHGAQVVVLSKGMNRRLGVKPETLSMLEEKGVDVRVEPTDAAVETYNDLRADGRSVGGLFHSTC
jgi:hypothetical protein